MTDSELVDIMRDICGINQKVRDYQQVAEAIGEILTQKCRGVNEPPVSDAAFGVFSGFALGMQMANELEAIDPSTVFFTEGKVSFTYITEPNSVPVVVTISAEEE